MMTDTAPTPPRFEGIKMAGVKSSTVFQEFMTLDPFTNKISGHGIITAECFQRWMSTRKNKIKHPEDSFRRTLLAHIRGSDGRRPFPEEVESSILQKLRTEKTPWKFLKEYRKNYNPTRKGFLAKNYGYHERLKLKLDSDRHKLETHALVSSKASEDMVYFNLLEVVQSMRTGFSTKLNLEPNVCYALNQLAKTNKFLREEFIFPTEEEKTFDKNKPVLRYSVNSNNCSYFWCNEVAQEVYGDISDTKMAGLSHDNIEFLNLGRHVVPMLKTQGKGWYRKRFRRSNGEFLTLLLYFEKGPNSFTYFLGQVV